jgi:acetolactate synthase I/II/III large subunit
VREMRGADLLVKCLELEGVKRIFGIPGEENLEIVDALYDSDIELVVTRHEQGAAFMAEVSARFTRRPGVCLSTLGPGATNLITGVADSFLCHQPLIVLTGQVASDEARPPRKQYLDLPRLFEPVTKMSFGLRSTDQVPSLVRRAFDIAMEERPGPVHLEIPENIMRAEAEGAPLPHEAHPFPLQEGRLRESREMMISSERPLILCGPGVIRQRAEESLRRYAERWQFPVVHTWLGNGVLAFDHPLSLHTIGLRKRDPMLEAFKESDLVILIGYDLLEFQPKYWNVGVRKKVMSISGAPMDRVPELTPDLELVGKIDAGLDWLSRDPAPKRSWAGDLRERLHSTIDDIPPDEGLVKPQLVVRSIRRALGREDIAVCDVGAHLLWMMRLFPTYKENTLLCSNGLVPMGFGVPAALAARLNNPERKVVAACGDGGFMMTSAELETAVRLETPFVTVVFNDSALGLIESKQMSDYGRSHGVKFGHIDLVKHAESLGADGIRVSSASELEEALRGYLREDALAVIDVPVDYRENQKLMS